MQDQAAAYWEKGGMPKEKIVVGVATYGRGWTLDDVSVADGVGAPGKTSRITKFVGEPGVAAYFEVGLDRATAHSILNIFEFIISPRKFF